MASRIAIPVRTALEIRNLVAGNDLNFAVMIAVSLMWMMKMPIHKIIDMVAVRDGKVSTPWAMNMVLGMPGALVPSRAGRRIGRCHLQRVLLHLTRSRGVMQMAIVEVIDMVAMLDCGVAAMFAMDVIVMFVLVCHVLSPVFQPCYVIGTCRQTDFSFSQPWAKPLAISWAIWSSASE